MDKSQLLDAVGMQEQVELIVQNNLQDMKQDHVIQVSVHCTLMVCIYYNIMYTTVFVCLIIFHWRDTICE